MFTLTYAVAASPACSTCWTGTRPPSSKPTRQASKQARLMRCHWVDWTAGLSVCLKMGKKRPSPFPSTRHKHHYNTTGPRPPRAAPGRIGHLPRGAPGGGGAPRQNRSAGVHLVPAAGTCVMDAHLYVPIYVHRPSNLTPLTHPPSPQPTQPPTAAPRPRLRAPPEGLPAPGRGDGRRAAPRAGR